MIPNNFNCLPHELVLKLDHITKLLKRIDPQSQHDHHHRQNLDGKQTQTQTQIQRQRKRSAKSKSKSNATVHLQETQQRRRRRRRTPATTTTAALGEFSEPEPESASVRYDTNNNNNRENTLLLSESRFAAMEQQMQSMSENIVRMQQSILAQNHKLDVIQHQILTVDKNTSEAFAQQQQSSVTAVQFSNMNEDMSRHQSQNEEYMRQLLIDHQAMDKNTQELSDMCSSETNALKVLDHKVDTIINAEQSQFHDLVRVICKLQVKSEEIWSSVSTLGRQRPRQHPSQQHQKPAQKPPPKQFVTSELSTAGAIMRNNNHHNNNHNNNYNIMTDYFVPNATKTTDIPVVVHAHAPSVVPSMLMPTTSTTTTTTTTNTEQSVRGVDGEHKQSESVAELYSAASTSSSSSSSSSSSVSLSNVSQHVSTLLTSTPTPTPTASAATATATDTSAPVLLPSHVPLPRSPPPPPPPRPLQWTNWPLTEEFLARRRASQLLVSQWEHEERRACWMSRQQAIAHGLGHVLQWNTAMVTVNGDRMQSLPETTIDGIKQDLVFQSQIARMKQSKKAKEKQELLDRKASSNFSLSKFFNNN